MARKPDGRSSIYLGKDGKWHGWVTMGVKDDGTPDRRHREAKTETEVTAKVRELENKRDSGRTTKTGKVPTVAEWMRTYLDEIAPARSVNSPWTAPIGPRPNGGSFPGWGHTGSTGYARSTWTPSMPGWPRKGSRPTRSCRFTASCPGH